MPDKPEEKPSGEPAAPPTAVEVVKDDTETRKKLKALETKQSWLEDQLSKVTADKSSLEEIVKKAQATPANPALPPARNFWEQFLHDIGWTD